MTTPLPSPLDNKSVARTLLEIADLLELKGENPFKIRAYRNAADVVSHAAEAVSALDEAGTARVDRHRQGPRRAHPRNRGHRRLRHPPGAADRVSGHAARRAAPAGRRSEDGRRALQGAAHQEPRRPRRRRESRPHPRAQGHGQQEGAADPAGDRGAAALRGPPPAVARDRDGATRSSPTCRSTRPAAEITTVGSVRRGAETSGDLDHPRERRRHHVSPMRSRSFPLVERVLANGGTKASVLIARRLPGRPAHRHARAARRGAAVLHRLKGPQHRPARSRARARLEAERIRALRRRRRSRSPARPNRTIYEALGLAFIEPELRENRGEIEAAADQALPVADHAGRSQGRPAHAHDRVRRPREPRDDGRGRAGARARVHRDHRSFAVARHGQRPRRRRGPWPTPSGFATIRRRRKASPSWPASSATSSPTARWISRTTASPRSTSSSRRFIRR